MKRLDLSCLPLNLEVGEMMELIDKDGKYHLLISDMVEKGECPCDGCFFSKRTDTVGCHHIKCYNKERYQEVRYVEIPVENEFKKDEESKDDVYYEELT